MRRFLLDTGMAGDFIDRRRGVYEHARHELAPGGTGSGSASRSWPSPSTASS